MSEDVYQTVIATHAGACEKFAFSVARDLFDYSIVSGRLYWRKDAGRWGRIKAGTIAGAIDPRDGRSYVFFQGHQCLVHRLIWLIVTGEWPSEVIDHFDGKPSNNAWKNLRDVSRAVNQQNRRSANKNNKSGLLGVFWNKSKSHWQADIRLNYKMVPLGGFDTPELAHEAYLSAKRRLHAGCTI